MIGVMYHYVRSAPADLPHFRFLHIDDFRRQLDWLMAERRFPTRDEFLASFDEGVDELGTILTFDDALTDHHRFVLPELADRGLWGIFYVPAGPYLDGHVLDVHKTHVLLGRHGGSAVLDALLEVVEPAMMVPEWVELLRDRTYRSQSNDGATLEVKQILNYFAKVEDRPVLLRRLEDHFRSPVAVDDVYLSEDQLRELHGCGMLLGSHAVTHRPMAQLPLEQQAEEIGASFASLERVVGRLPVRTFCYPYGGFDTFTIDTERLLTEAGCRFSFNVEPRPMTDADLRERPQALPRLDCNLLPHGASRGG